MERRDFLKNTLAICGLAALPIAVVESCKKTSYSGPTNVDFTLDLTNSANTALNTVGGAVIANGVIVIRKSSTSFVAFSSTCTHEGCTVGYNASSTNIVCPCHNGTFSSSNGSVISGPPPSALSSYTATLNGNTLTVKS
jgi:cytochrome b6-f complex iron-sulfur subunit